MSVSICAGQDSPLPFRLSWPAVVVIVVVLASSDLLAWLKLPTLGIVEVIGGACIGAARLLPHRRED